jgi:hypothetical protein
VNTAAPGTHFVATTVGYNPEIWAGWAVTPAQT